MNFTFHPVFNMEFPLFKWMYAFLGFIPENEFSILYLSMLSSILLMSNVDYNKFPLMSFKINKTNTMDLFNLMLFLFILTTSIWFDCYDIVLLFFILIYVFGNLIKYFFLKFIK